MPADSKVTLWAVEEFAGGFASAVEGMAGERPGLASQLLPALAEPAAPLFRWTQPFAGLPGEALVLASEADVLAIGQHVMVAAGIEDASPDELKSTFRESLGQAFSVLARAMTTRLQREVTPGPGAEAPATATGLAWGEARLTLAGKAATILLGLPAQMLEVFTPEPKAVAAVAAAGPQPTPSQPAHTNEESKTFDLLLDVELPVSVSFGHAQVPLKDVLKLTTGSIVELSRAVIEPVDIVVNNCIIARGEVVVVEGNFGVRIQQVISRSERLRSLQ
jgi:flagellar motor switch protein FliN/FliY